MIRLSWDRFAADTRLLAEAIRAKGDAYDRMLCIARGGVFVGGLLAHLLDYRKITTISLWHYRDHAPGEAVEFLSAPDLPKPGSRLLVVDDLVDTGRTFAYVQDHFRRDFRLVFAALYDKGGGAIRPDFRVRDVPDEWIAFPWEETV